MRKSLKRLENQLQEMDQKMPFLDSINPLVSQVPLSWHLAHNLKVMQEVLSALRASDPQTFKKQFSWKKELIFLTGKIPRGKVRAPKNVLPKSEVSAEELKQQIEATRVELSQFSNLSKNAFFPHPFFGNISRDEASRFLAIHTEHHLKIMRDILKKDGS